MSAIFSRRTGNFWLARFSAIWARQRARRSSIVASMPGWIAAGWAGLALLLIAVAWSAKQEVFLHHSLLLAVAVVFRGVLIDLAEPGVIAGAWFSSRSQHVIAAAALLFAAQAFAFPLRSRYAAANAGPRIGRTVDAHFSAARAVLLFHSAGADHATHR